MSDYKPKLKMNQFKKIKREHTEEDLQNAIKKASARYMQPEVLHDVKITAIIKDSVKFNENNPTWLQFGISLENASGESTNMYILMPVGQDLEFVSRSGSKTSMPLANFGKFIEAVGLVGYSTAFIDRVVETDCECLEGLVGFQLRYIAKWNKKKVHPWYDSEKQAFFLVDAQDRLVIDEPFQLPSKDEVDRPELRWAEMATRAEDEGFSFESQAQGNILPLPSIQNPINQLGLHLTDFDDQAERQSREEAKPTQASRVKKPIQVRKPAVAKIQPKFVTPKDMDVEADDDDEEEFDPSELED